MEVHVRKLSVLLDVNPASESLCGSCNSIGVDVQFTAAFLFLFSKLFLTDFSLNLYYMYSIFFSLAQCMLF